jgi:hypothetical protein
MALFNFSRRKEANSETARRATLLQRGRITEGTIIDCAGSTPEEITQIYYIYSVNGADYESSEILNEEQRGRANDYFPGAKVSVRYDPGQPGNSIVV